jgi:uncharacterized protein (TIGR03437 family)
MKTVIILSALLLNLQIGGKARSQSFATPSIGVQASPASFGPISVPATSVIFDPDSALTAARLAALMGGNGDHSPAPAVLALSFTAAPGQVFTFSASGTVSYNDTESSANVGPDGAAGSESIPSLGSISGFVAPLTFPLVGVFTNGSPTGPAPASYNYSGGVGQETFAPLLNQVFFIGDGLTGTGSGSRQTFYVPATATQLWIGFADSGPSASQQPGAYGDNTGSLTVSGTLNPGALPNPPSISSNGIVPVYSSSSTIEAGSWVSIYGTGLAASSTTWTGDFPTSLGGTSVTINGKYAYLWFVSPTQINLQAPDDTATGTVAVTVTTASGTASSTVILGPYAPSFSMLSATYPAAIVLTPGSPGNSGGGYDIIGPAGAFSFPTRPVKAGETLILYGVGFGPTDPPVPAGRVFSGPAAFSPSFPTVTIGGVTAAVTFSGIVEAGLFQLNVVVPTLSTGDQPLIAQIGGLTTPANVHLTIQ